MFLRHLSKKYLRHGVLNVNRCFSTFDLTQGLTSEQIEYQSMALDFASNEMLPYASKWDNNKIFPEDTFKGLAELGFGGLFVKEDVGGINMKRSDGTDQVIEFLKQAQEGNS